MSEGDRFVSSTELARTVGLTDHPLKGQDQPGRARCAAARLAAQPEAVTLDRHDHEALAALLPDPTNPPPTATPL